MDYNFAAREDGEGGDVKDFVFKKFLRLLAASKYHSLWEYEGMKVA